ncbi:serine/threonine-protein kinase Nek11-like [Tubulanus polymorphus]|uniref:serine/threonine-protein kinase Nek11-like n=1 Tax=Tubulanus polymorphus TaxID=672921 RepID=UPI003DA578F1
MPLRRTVKDKASAKKRVLANRYQVEKRLGSGNFGTAFLVTDLKCTDEANRLKVLKEIPVGDLLPDETVDAVHEANLLAKLDHPNIVKFYDKFLDGEYFCIVTEYCEGGDLDVQISQMNKSGKSFDETLILDWLVQLLLAVQYMHSQSILHRDLKTRNIFLRNNMIKIGDFGISRILMGTSDMASTFTGTPYYMSPEVLKHEGYNSKSDVWSVGCILYELCALQHAFEGQNLMGVMYKIVEGQCPEMPSQYTSQITAVLKRMLTKNPVERPSAGEVLKMSFIAKQMERMKETMSEKRYAKDSTVIATKDTADIAQVLRVKYKLRDLQEKEKQDKWKNLSARERMRLRKQQKADEEYRKIQEAAKAQFLANQTQRSATKLSFDSSKPPPWSRSAEQKTRIHDIRYNLPVDPKPAPMYHDDDDDIVVGNDDDDNDETLRAYNSALMERDEEQTVKDEGTLLQPVYHRASDDRPITPMKNTMVYNMEHSSLDFKDGIPDEPQLAETYYSQYNDFEEDEAPSGSDDEQQDEFSDDEYGDLIDCMESALASTDAGELGHTATIMDDVKAGAYGPTVREIKIKNMRAECEKALGDKNFQKVYDYLKNARKTTQDENKIHKGLIDIVDNMSDCFLVDQLLFLEEQAKLS